ncbi:MAG: AAA family ATPase [Oscillospiraceae bacterium]|nr:AAA family ATPase [Oscillospiraceae bacterium]
MSKYNQELHSNYQKAIQAFLNVYPGKTDKMSVLIDSYCRTCALYLWNTFGVDLSVCTDGINELYAEDKHKRAYTTTQVASALNKLAQKQYTLPVPEFFENIVAQDRIDGTNYSRKLASCLSLVFISFALIDGNVTAEEAKMITKLQSDLVACCDKSKITAYADTIDIAGFVDSDPVKPAAVAPVYKQSAPQKKAPADTKPKKQADSMAELNKLIGLSAAKQSINELRDFAKIQQARKNRGLPVSDISYHLVFTGNPGTGKTTVARLVAQIYKELGLVSKGHLVEASAKDLVAGYVGQTAIKTGEVINEALGGVLFIDEAYALVDTNGQGYGQEAIDTILKEMEDHRDDLAVIVAGYSEPMEEFIRSNPGLKSRFNRFVHFDDFAPEELFEIFQSLCKKNAYTTDEKAAEIIKEHLAALSKSAGDDFANARTVRNFFETVIAKQATRISGEKDPSTELLSTITEADVTWCTDADSKAESLEDVLSELTSWIGLEMVKEEIADLIHVVEHQQRRKAQGLRIPSMSLHLVFMGNPGTGKTTVARYIARLYKSLGLLSKGHLVETDRSGLVAGYVGQTAIKTQDIINEAMGGVLFIDEAYTLNGSGSNDYGQEAIDTLLKAMEDKRDDFVVIVAGYPELMDNFVHSNPGLESRFNRYIHFEDYSADEMLRIFKMSCDKNQYVLTEAAETAVKDYFATVSISTIANGRGARNLFEKVVTQQAKRIASMSESHADELSTITEDDIKHALARGDK